MTKTISRRRFNQRALTAGAAALSAASFPAIGAAKPRLVVIGGGPGGATVARQVASAGAVDVTLVEEQKTYTTCFFSNLYLGGFRSFESITHDYVALSTRHGVNVVHARAVGVDPGAKTVRLESGVTLPYDRLVMAPGIDFRWDAIEGYDEAAAEVMPHAYKAGVQTRLLKAVVEAVPDGGLFVVAAPANPFRCPPGPYERISMIAHHFKQHKPKSKILVIDAKNSFSKQGLFQAAWERFYPGMVEWLPADITDGGVKAVNTSSMEVITAGERFKAAGANIIPPQTAGRIAIEAQLANDSGWCPVHADTLASRQVADVYLVGDAIIPGDMPKSAFSANSQAKVCANAILADLADKRRFPPRFRNTCWSLVATDHGLKVGANYEATPEKIKSVDSFLSAEDESDAIRASTAEEGDAWYAAFTSEIYR